MKMHPRLKMAFLTTAIAISSLLSPGNAVSQKSIPLVTTPSAVSNSLSISEPLQTSKKRKIPLDSELENRLKTAFLDEICKIRADSGYALMPIRNQKLAQSAQEYADTLQPLPPSMLSHNYVPQNERFYPLYTNKSLNLKNFSIRECIHLHQFIMPPGSNSLLFTNQPISLTTAQKDLFESEARKAARDLLTSPKHRRILLCICSSNHLLAGAGISISSSKEGLLQLLAVYIKAESNNDFGHLQTKERK